MAIRNTVTGLLLLVLAAPVAGCSPAPEEFSFRTDCQRIAGLQLWDDEPRGPRPVAEVADPALVAFFVQQLDAAKPAVPPDPPPNRHYLSFRVATGTPPGKRGATPTWATRGTPKGRATWSLTAGGWKCRPRLTGFSSASRITGAPRVR